MSINYEKLTLPQYIFFLEKEIIVSINIKKVGVCWTKRKKNERMETKQSGNFCTGR